MTEGTAIAATPARPQRQLRAGATALAIVPQTIDDVWRIARMIVVGRMAPDSLVKNKDPEEAVSAVSTIIMSGLELGLSPMVAMRSFGMINGRPGLYGDGLINVCRRHSSAAYVKLGFVPGKDETFGDDAYGYCEAKRSDSDEVAREEFSVADAKRSGLWEESAVRRAKVWRNGAQVWVDDAPNDSPWFRYPKRMLQWRAAGYNLRNLFADVLGGIPTMDEVEEIEREDEMRDITPVAQIARGGPPSPPADDEEEQADASSHFHSDEPDPVNIGEILDEIEDALRDCNSADEVEENFDALDIQARLSGNDEALGRAFAIRTRRALELSPDIEENNGDDQP